MPTAIPSTQQPTYTPSYTPSKAPSAVPSTQQPTNTPSYTPTQQPTYSPSYTPSRVPSYVPSAVPSTQQPTYSPSYTPSRVPSCVPSAVPSTQQPTNTPSYTPSNIPSAVPSTQQPTNTPSYLPSTIPSAVPSTQQPTYSPSYTPSRVPSCVPSAVPSTQQPTNTPSYTPSKAPSAVPSTQQPTNTPSYTPSRVPSHVPSAVPSTQQPTNTPSYTPSTIPSAVPSTASPSTTPTQSPSSYPTYSSSVRVYFVVTQGLTGMSAATYSSNRESNDMIFKQTVVSMLGYDCQYDDVTIQLISSTVQSRSLVSSSISTEEITVMYSISTPTFIFNDTNQATNMFIQALNESIVTEEFDTLLHGSTGSTWQSVTTTYAIFSTASPTSSPTSTPTSAPTKLDNIVANLLTIPLDNSVAKAKIKYYLGAFMGYFLGIYICLYLYSFLRYGNATATQLYDTSYQSETYVRCTAVPAEENKDALLSDLCAKNALVQRNMLLGEKLRLMKQATSKKLIIEDDEDALLEDEDRYSKGYRKYMYQKRTLLGCSPVLYPDGYVVKIPCTNREIVSFPPGRVEDLLLYICHNHPLFSCFYFMEGSKLGGHGTRILYIGKDIAVFVLYQFSNMLLQYFMLDDIGLGTFINLFIITPSAVSIGLLLKYLYTCPFTESLEFQRKYANYKSTVLFLGRLAIVPIMLIMFGSLIIACLFSSNRGVPLILINYFIYVQFYGILLALTKTPLLFIDGYFYRICLFGLLEIVCVGQLYKERILAEQLVVNVDYACRVHSYLFGLIKVQKILNRNDAIKAKWITEGDVYDIEMKGDGFVSNVTNDTPTEELSGDRISTVFSMDGIFGASSTISSNNHDISFVTVENRNPIHSLASVATRLQSSADDAAAAADAVDVDAALYLEYQNSLQGNHNDALYDMSKNEDQLTFEEWKTTRKQFKQGNTLTHS